MIAVAVLLTALGLSWFLLAGRGTGALTVAERTYLVASPLPVIVMFGIPLVIELLRIPPEPLRPWNSRLEPTAVWLSAALVLAGVALIWRRWVRGEDRKGRLTAGLFLAGIPAFLALVVVLLYGLRHNA